MYVKLIFQPLLLIFFIQITSLHIYADRVENAFNQAIRKGGYILEKKYKLKLIGTGGSLDENFIGKFNLSFEIEKQLTKQEIRTLLINLNNDFHYYLNNFKDLKPYLNPYPFPKEKIWITLFVFGKNKKTLVYPDICVGSIYDGFLDFDTNDPVNFYAPYKTSEKETYEETLKALEEEI